MDDLLSEFLTETAENLSVLDLEVVKLEQNPNDPGLLSNIFRLVHTIKGTCGFLGLPRLEAVAHAAENVLGKFRDGEVEVSPEAVTLILQALDTIKLIMAGLEATEEEPAGDDTALTSRLNAMADGDMTGNGAAPTAEPPAADDAVEVSAAVEEAEAPADVEEADAAVDASAVDASAELDDFPATMAQSEPEPEPESEPEPEPQPTAAAQPARTPTPGTRAPEPAPVEARESSVAQQSIRVNVELLENLMTMVSELVLTRNQVMQILRTQKESEFAGPLQRLNHVTSELQEGVMKTRMQPIGNAWAKLPRLIRDLSHELGKKIELEMVGADTELDRQVLELIKDPLTHMIRNSADHGVEMPAERVARGKPETGRVRLNAFHEGGHIIIEISDDGQGLSTEKIKTKVVSNGLASEAELVGMSNQQIQQFIFKPGFSTATKVTSVSGRGVGMDVVRTNIEKIGGTIELQSVEGKGSKFVIKIPLTLAIVSALVVECAGERFAIPQISVVELVRAGGHSEHTVETINDTPVLRLRDRLLPLVSLKALLRIDADGDGPVSAKEVAADVENEDEAFIVVTQVGNYSFGIIVDRVFDTEEIVVKPVAPVLRHIDIFSGNTILGDGSVIMILDPNGIASATGEISIADSTEATAAAMSRVHGEENVALLLFRAGQGAPKAVPLALVARLEDVDEKSIEVSNGRMMVQYRGKLMPLVPFDPGYYVSDDPESSGRRPVLVFADMDRSMGLIVDEIVDIVEQRMNVEMSGEQPGLIGSAIIADKATDVIDAGYYLTQAYHDWFAANGEAGDQSGDHHDRVLLVDDSPFFRNMLTPLLTVAGYDVVSVESASDALALCDAGEAFDIIVSDIEMPGMNGFDFAHAVKAGDSRWRQTPIVALSSHATPRDLDRGRAAGFNDYVAKFDRDALLHTLHETLADCRGAAE